MRNKEKEKAKKEEVTSRGWERWMLFARRIERSHTKNKLKSGRQTPF